jgi:hypothetical protein
MKFPGVEPSWHSFNPLNKARALRLLLGLFLLSLAGTGCVTHKRTWQDWMTVAPMEQVAQSNPPALAMPVLPPDAQTLFRPPYTLGDGARVGWRFDLAMRNPDFPQTYIAAVHIDLTSPCHWVQLLWAGPQAKLGPVGPWHSSPGRGLPDKDCDDVADSNSLDSCCTPKGVFRVAGFDDRLNIVPSCRYATWVIHEPRFIALHSHTDIPSQPVSHGCIRLPFEAAKLIHNNSLAGVTLIQIEGKWIRPVGLPDESPVHVPRSAAALR